MTKATQKEFKKMPKRDKVGRAAKSYIKAKEAIDAAKDKLEDAGAALLKALKEARRKEITVDGVKVTWRHVDAKDVINVKKPKDK